MPIFNYKAVTRDGQTIAGLVEAKDRFAVYDKVRQDGGTIVSISKEGGLNVKEFVNRINFMLSGIKDADLIMFARNMSTMIGAGLALSRALSVMEKQTKNPKFQKIIADINNEIRKGASLHKALDNYQSVFSPLFRSMVRAGEESGKLTESLDTVAKQIDRSYRLKRRVKGAMMYPSIIIVAMIIIGIVMLIVVVPTLTSTFEELDVELPQSTQIIIGLSDFLISNTFSAIGLLVFLIGLVVYGMRTPRGKRIFEAAILRIPIIKTLVQETNSARTARTLSSLLSSGVEVVTAISITRDVVQNSYHREVLERAQKYIEKGQPIAKAFSERQDLYPVLLSEMIAVGEETGKVSDMLIQIAEFYEEEIEQKTKDLSTVIEPILMIVIGIGVGFFAISMISPIYSISGAI